MSPITWNPLLAGTILVLALGDPTSACSCSPLHPQAAFCQADVVIRGRFMGVTQVNHSSSSQELAPWSRYEIKASKIYKGSETVGDIHFLHTPALDSLCGYQHTAPLKGKEYLIMAKRQGEHLTVTACSFVRPWAHVTPRQRHGISHAYTEGCSCNVVPCISMPCVLSSDDQCLWTDGLLDRSWVGHQAKHLACLPRPTEGSAPPTGLVCSWESLKSGVSKAVLKAAQTTVH